MAMLWDMGSALGRGAGVARAGVRTAGKGLSPAAVSWHTPTSQRNDSFCQCQTPVGDESAFNHKLRWKKDIAVKQLFHPIATKSFVSSFWRSIPSVFLCLLKVHCVTFGPLAVKTACILRDNIVLFVLWLCVTLWMDMIILLLIKHSLQGLRDIICYCSYSH